MTGNTDSATHEKIAAALRAAAGIIHRTMRNLDAAARLKREPEDILSEFYLFLLELDARPLELYEGRNGAQFGSYVGKIFLFWLNRRLNRKQNHEITLSDLLTEKISDTRKPVEVQVEEDQAYVALRNCIKHLENTEKRIINEYLDYQTKLSVISRKLGISQVHIYGIWEKITRQLKSCLENKGFTKAMAV
jgi:RNA polymerase sigma factor (sigma-70 family)